MLTTLVPVTCVLNTQPQNYFAKQNSKFLHNHLVDVHQSLISKLLFFLPCEKIFDKNVYKTACLLLLNDSKNVLLELS